MSRKVIAATVGFFLGAIVAFGYRLFQGLSSGSIYSFNIGEVFSGAWTDAKFYVIFLIVFVVTALLVLIRYAFYGEADDERNFWISRKGTKGTSGEMTKEEFDEELKHQSIKEANEFIFGYEKCGLLGRKKLVTINADHMRPDDNRNIFIIGAMGSRKSQFMRVNIMQLVRMGYSMYITDSAGDIYGDLSIYLEKCGYVVKVLNTINPEASDAFNMLKYAYESDTIDVFVKVILDNVKSTLKESEGFFEDANIALLSSLCHLVMMEQYSATYLNGREGTFQDAYNALLDNTESELNAIFTTMPKTSFARKYWNSFQESTNKANTYSGMKTRLHLWMRNDIAKITSVEDIDLELPGKKKCAYFCITSDQTTTRSAIATLFFQFLTITLTKQADSRREKKLKVPVHLVLDEFVHMGRMSNFSDQYGTWRKRCISATIITQSLGDLRKAYPDEEAEAILNGSRYNLFMGCGDQTTLEYYEFLAGIASVRSRNKTSITGNISPLGRRRMDSETERPYMRGDEFRTLNKNKLILIVYGCHIKKLNKYVFYEDPRGKMINKTPEKWKRLAEEHKPTWSDPYAVDSADQEKEVERKEQPTVKEDTREAEIEHADDTMPKAKSRRSSSSKKDTDAIKEKLSKPD